MNKLTLTLAAAALFTGLTAAAEETPAITLKTGIYDLKGASNYFSLYVDVNAETYFDVDCGFGPVEVKATPDPSGNGTLIGCTVSSAGEVKIYGDPSLINYFYAEGCYINDLDISKLTNLQIVNVAHNELPSLDLSAFTQLQAIYAGDNPYGVSPLVIGDNHPELAIIDLSLAGKIDQSFDISTFPELKSFDAYGCPTITHLDPTKCPKLLRLSLDLCPIKSLDVTKNPLLLILNVEDSGISSIDLSQNPLLTEFYGTHMSGSVNTDAKFSSVDFSNNPELQRLALGGNNLTSIDVSKNPKLIYLNVRSNQLTDIDLSNNQNLGELNLMENYFGFATLPLPRETMSTYWYEQRPVRMDKSYAINTVLDLSDKVIREGTVTTAKMFAVNAAGEQRQLDASFFDFADGKVTLKRVWNDSVYMQFDNDVFNEYPMTTERFCIKSAANFGKPSKIVTMGTSLDNGQTFDMTVGLAGATADAPKKFYVNLGDGTQQEFTATSAAGTRCTFTRNGSGYVEIYIPEGDILTALGLEDVALYSIDLSAATQLEHLTLEGTDLYDINLGYNRHLRSLNLSRNNFSSLSLEGVNAAFGKNSLADIDLSHNKLNDLKLNDSRAIHNLDLSDNLLEDFKVKEFDNINSFKIADNRLTTVNLAYMTAATDIDVSGNLLTEVLLPETNVFRHFDIRNNNFTIATMPELFAGSTDVFLYAPQRPLAVPTKGPGMDLSVQNRVIDGQGTSYRLLDAAGNALTEGTDYTVEGGRISFLTPVIGKQVHASMTNPAFPAFEADPLLTTGMEAAGFPTNCIASFVTSRDGDAVGLSLGGTDGSAVYFDWAGDGKTLAQYPLKETYTRYEATTVAGADVKVYTYSPDDRVTIFSITGARMTSCDLKNLVDASTITVAGAGLSEITLPEDKAKIKELTLDGNNFTTFDLSPFTNLYSLSLSSNLLTELDLTKAPALNLASATFNKLTDVKLDNPHLWFLNLGSNLIESIDLTKVPTLEQLGLMGNKLRTIDLSSLHALKGLTLDKNYFTFATLPVPKEQYVSYGYANQANIAAVCNDGVVDLSDQKEVNGTPTVFRWFLGTPVIDENGQLDGEELEAGSEYTCEEGVTSFHRAFNRVQCVMYNEVFPNMLLYTDLMNVTSGIADAATDEIVLGVTVSDGTVTVTAPVADGTPAALYTMDGRLAGSATFSGGTAVIGAAPRGAAILTAGSHATKIIVK